MMENDIFDFSIVQLIQLSEIFYSNNDNENQISS